MRATFSVTFIILTNPLGKVIFRTDTLDSQFIGKWKSNVVRQMTFLLKPEE